MFHDITLKISGSNYVTSNYFFSEISDLNVLINGWISSSELSVHNMGINMKLKFDKYWGDPQKMNALIFIAAILDPRYKLEFLAFSFNQIYGNYGVESNLLINMKSDYASIV